MKEGLYRRVREGGERGEVREDEGGFVYRREREGGEGRR